MEWRSGNTHATMVARQEMDMEALAKAWRSGNTHATKADGVIHHDDTTAEKWKEVKTPTAPKAKDKRGNSIVAAEGGLPPTCLADDHVHDPDDEDKKTIKHKSEKSNPVENRSPDMQPESDKKDEMSAEQQRLFEFHNAMEYMVKDKDPDMQMIVQTMLDMVNTV